MLRIASLTFSASKVVACPSVAPISVHLTPKDCSTGYKNIDLVTLPCTHVDLLDIDIHLCVFQIDQVRNERRHGVCCVSIPDSI
jgi:hypothetical protein